MHSPDDPEAAAGGTGLILLTHIDIWICRNRQGHIKSVTSNFSLCSLVLCCKPAVHLSCEEREGNK